MQATTDDPDGEWVTFPTVLDAAMYATPFPGFDADGEWQIRATVHDINTAHIGRLVERERAV